MPHDIIDNRELHLADAVRPLLSESVRAHFAVGYFFLSGFKAIAEQLATVQELRLLIGNTSDRATVEQLPGHVAPHATLGAPFTTAPELQEHFASAVSARDQLRAEMIALQEEMDWLVYSAYGLLGSNHPAAQIPAEPAPLDQALRPFRLVERAETEMESWPQAAPGVLQDPISIPQLGLTYLPKAWPDARKRLWEARMWAIFQSEDIRRIEQPVYKRRWDEQWKVSNRWMAGPVAYAQELVDAFRWWLAEKAEWHLENKANGGPVELAGWAAALWKDKRIQAAWTVIAEAVLAVERWRFENAENKDGKKAPESADSYEAFAKFFKETVQDECVPDGIPPAIPWDDLAAKKKWPTSQLKKAQTVRGKLNVPRERFRQTADGSFVWAGRV